ncbi:MAG: hypothetical protein M3357_18785 [Actinomycetota bacterium]|nr:hypothetical protein [Actinomycetota bacterium]
MLRAHLRRSAVALVAVLAATAAWPGPAAGDRWSFFGGDAGRSGHQPVSGGVAPAEPVWGVPETPNVVTSVLTTGGPPGQARVIYGTGDRRTPEGDIVGGRVHIRTLLGGVPVTPPEGIKVSDEADAFGDGFGTVGFADTSTDGALGQAWLVFNDINGVSIVQIDEATGEVVQERAPDPADINDKLVGVTINSSILLTPPDPNGDTSLFFVAFGDVNPVETLYKVTVLRAGTRQATISDITTVNGDFNLVDFASPSLVYLTANASNNEAHVAVGDCRGRLYTFAVDNLAPGPIAAVGAGTDCVLTASSPVTPDGVPPGAPGSGLERTPVIYVATSDAEGTSTRVHRLIQETSIQFRREPDDPPVLAGGPANALAVDATVMASGTLTPGGRVYVTTGRNLYVLDARDLTQILAKLDPDDALVPGDTGFSQTSPAVNGELLFVSRDNGDHLVLDKRTLAPAAGFGAAAAARPGPGSLSFGQPSLAGRTAVFGSTKGVYCYRLRAPAPPVGYWLAAADGAVFSFGDAGFFGSMGGTRLVSPVEGIAATPSGAGYWLVARDGGVFAFGDAGFFGSAAERRPGSPVVAMVPTATGRGYWVATSAGEMFNFGDAAAFGPVPLSRGDKAVGIAATPTGRGIWVASAAGGVFTFGDAGFFGSAGATRLAAPVVGIASTPAGNGYWLMAADGGVLTFGAAGFHGSTGGIRLSAPVVGGAGGQSGFGYTLAAADGGTFTFGDARFHGSTGGIRINGPVVAIATKG